MDAVFAVEIPFDDSIIRTFYDDVKKHIYSSMDEEEIVEKLILSTDSIDEATSLYFKY